MLTKHIALVDNTKKISHHVLSQTAAALQKQATRDLGPIWNIQATVSYFPDANSVPLGYWPIIIMKKLDDPDAGGYHDDKNHQPFSLVLHDDSWQLSCSHEMCEMLVDPYGRRLHAADSIVPAQGRVNYLVEASDPCEDAAFAYPVNGILMSDFYTPHYFDPVKNVGVRYSYTGALTEPRQILKGGYLSWYNPADKEWYQATYFGASVKVAKLESMKNFQGSIRMNIDRLTKHPDKIKALKAISKAKTDKMKLTRDTSKFVGRHITTEIKKFAK